MKHAGGNSRLNHLLWLFIPVFLIVLFYPDPAEALPLFAKKYRLPCKTCHEAFPKLNDFGEAFRSNGYQLKTGTDVIPPAPDAFPSTIAMRTTVIADIEAANHMPTDIDNSDTVTTGTLALTGIDLFSAGVLAEAPAEGA